MKRTTAIILLLWTLAAAFAQTPQQLLEKGNAAYGKGNFELAAQCYSAILDSGQRQPQVYYNLGNAYYRLDEYGLAILNYERALKLKPGYRDARQNLDLANSKTEDQIAVLPELFVARWARAVVAWFSPAGWHVLLLCLLAALGALVAVLVLSRHYAWRKSALIGSIIVGILILFCTACTLSATSRQRGHSDAIVTMPMVVVKSSPERSSVDKLILHEGTKVAIEETLDDWHKIRIADGNTGWISTSDVTII